MSLQRISHLALIMDGNRRWAKERNLPQHEGHKAGMKALKSLVISCLENKIKYLTVYAFSTENWERQKTEVSFLMSLLEKNIEKEALEMSQNGVKLKFIGDINSLDLRLREKIKKSEEITKNSDKLNFQIAFNYGARLEIVQAVHKTCLEFQQKPENFKNLENIQEFFSSCLYTYNIINNIPDPDLLIRTGGQKRMSNFLLWQIAYSELIFTDILWPDFDKNCLESCLKEYSLRLRNYGK